MVVGWDSVVHIVKIHFDYFGNHTYLTLEMSIGYSYLVVRVLLHSQEAGV